jgi:zinc-finger-containing domain
MEPEQIHIDIINGKVCPYCRKNSIFIDSKEIYNGKSYGMIYICRPCDAYVGVHKGTTKALGRLANKQLRQLKKEAHFYFDQIWMKKRVARKQAYKMLARYLGITKKYCHIGMFKPDTCRQVIEFSKNYLNNH